MGVAVAGMRVRRQLAWLSFCSMREEASRMTAEYTQGEEPLIPMPALTLDALRQAVAAVAPSRLPEFFQEIQDAFSQAGDEDSVFPIRHFYQRWGATVAIERRPSVAARLHAPSGHSLTPTLASGTGPSGKLLGSFRRPTARSRVADWRWECVSDDLLDKLPPPMPCRQCGS
jgi:hypothetical protein